MIDAIELLRQASEMCFKSGYERGTVECLNMIVRACSNANDLALVRACYKMLVNVYIYFRQFHNAIRALDRQKDLALDYDDNQALVLIYFKMA